MKLTMNEMRKGTHGLQLNMSWHGFTRGFELEEASYKRGVWEVSHDGWDDAPIITKKYNSLVELLQDWKVLTGGLTVTLRNGAFCFSAE